jgi:cytochrome c oxidase assembly protein subunit 19
MTTSNALSGGKPSRPIPPEEGSFPLDRDGVCAEFARAVIKCFRENGGRTAACRSPQRAYLDCRMKHGLMRPEDFSELGFDEENDATLSAFMGREGNGEPDQTANGRYVAGLRYHRSRRRHREQVEHGAGTPNSQPPAE